MLFVSVKLITFQLILLDIEVNIQADSSNKLEFSKRVFMMNSDNIFVETLKEKVQLTRGENSTINKTIYFSTDVSNLCNNI